MSVFHSRCMVGREIRQIDLIKSIMAVFPCVPDQFSVYNRRCTVGKISGHFVCRASLLAGSVNGSIINITLTGPEKHEAVAAGFYKMHSRKNTAQQVFLRILKQRRQIHFWNDCQHHNCLRPDRNCRNIQNRQGMRRYSCCRMIRGKS